MKNIIVIPTYRGHLGQVEAFLHSFSTFALDAGDIPIKLIISRDEYDDFSRITKTFSKKLDIETHDLRKILRREESVDVGRESKLLQKIGKFNFQALKKLYGVKYFDHDLALVLDSEALMIRPYNFKQVFDDYNGHKFVFYSGHTKSEFQRRVTENCLRIFNRTFADMWMLESQYWFYDSVSLSELFRFVREFSKTSVFESFCRYKPIFPENFYYLYLYFHTGKTSYHFLSSRDVLKQFLSPEEMNKYEAKIKGYDVTLFEYFSWGLTRENLGAFEKIYGSYFIKFFKYDDRHGQPENIETQKEFIKRNKDICLLPCRVVCQPFEINGFVVPANHSVETAPSPSRMRKLGRWVKNSLRHLIRR